MCVLSAHSRSRKNETGRLRPRLEHEIYRLVFICSHRNFLALGTELLMPRLDRVGTGRKTFQIETPVLIRNHKIRMFENCYVASHPRVHVALDWDGDLFPRKGFFDGQPMWLRLIPFPIVVWHRMNVVRSFVAVDHIQLLVRLQRKHMRLVLAAFLLDDGGLRRRFKCSVPQTVGNINDNVCQASTSTDYDILCRRWRGMRFGTV